MCIASRAMFLSVAQVGKLLFCRCTFSHTCAHCSGFSCLVHLHIDVRREYCLQIIDFDDCMKMCFFVVLFFFCEGLNFRVCFSKFDD